MKNDDRLYERAPKEETTAASHWLYANMPDGHDNLRAEVVRLQRTIAALIAVGSVTQEKAFGAYTIAGSFD